MTAINLVLTPDALHVFTDGAVCSPTGEIMGLQDKVGLFPHLAACVAVRGTIAHTRRIQIGLSGVAGDFQTLIDRAPTIAVEGTLDLVGPHGHGFEMVLAGWSPERGAFEAYQLIHRGEPLPAAWTSSRIGSLVSPYDDEIAASLAAVGIAPGRAPPPVRDFGLAVTTAQRSAASLTLTGARLRTVGGFCQVTTIRRDGITTEILKRWTEDRIGQRIGGGLDGPLPGLPTGR